MSLNLRGWVVRPAYREGWEKSAQSLATNNNEPEFCRLAQAILCLDGLTGGEIEAAERVLAVDRADIRRLREIAGNHRENAGRE